MTETLDRPTTAPDEQPRAAVVAHELGHLLVAWHHHAYVRLIHVVPEVVDGRISLGCVDLDDTRVPARERAMIALAGPLNAHLWDYPVGPGSVDDLMRVAALGFHHQDRDLVRDTIRILTLHRRVEDELRYYLEDGDRRGEYDAEWLRHWRKRVQGAALASLVLDDDTAPEFHNNGTVTVTTLFSTPDEGELLVDALRTPWRRTPADDWRGQRWLRQTAGSIKDRMDELPVRKVRAPRRTSKAVAR